MIWEDCYLIAYTNLTEGTPINTPRTRPQLVEMFGKLTMPTLVALYVISEVMEHAFPGEPLFLRKSDVARAFQRMIWKVEVSLLLALLLSPDNVLVPSNLNGVWQFRGTVRLWHH